MNKTPRRNSKRLLEYGCFTEEKTWDQQREDYLRASDSAKAYIELCLETSTVHEDYILYDEMYTSYVLWCNREKLPSTSKGEFTKKLMQNLPNVKDGDVRVDGKKYRCWRYVKYVEVGASGASGDVEIPIKSDLKKFTDNNSDTPAPDAPLTPKSIGDIEQWLLQNWKSSKKDDLVTFIVANTRLDEEDALAFVDRLMAEGKIAEDPCHNVTWVRR